MTPERQRQEDVWVNSGEDRVQLPRQFRKTFGNSPRSELYVSAGHSTLQDNGPGTPPARTLRNSVRVCNFHAAVKNKTSHPGVRRAIKSINLITAVTPAFMNYRALVKVFYHSAILLACITLSCRPQQAVILSGRE